jgi:hypothetical protein
MSFKKQFRAVPIRPSADYRAKLYSHEFESDKLGKRKTLVIALVGLAIGGALGGVYLAGPSWLSIYGASPDSTVVDPQGRLRAPQEGDWWIRCAHAQAAGTAPIFANEPGYRAGLDADGDGIACEPIPSL